MAKKTTKKEPRVELVVVDWQDKALKQFTLPEHLEQLAKQASKFDITSFRDKEVGKQAHDKRIELRDARVELEKIGLLIRSQATSFGKRVIKKEDELIAIISGEEKRLKEAEELVALEVERAKRIEKLPERKARLNEIGFEVASDEALLEMDAEQFEAHFNQCVADNNKREADRIEAERVRQQAEVQAKLDADRAEIDRQRAENEKEAQRLENERLARQREDLARQEGEKAAHAATTAREVQMQKDQALMEKRAKFQDFRKSHGWTEETKADFKTEETPDGYVLYKKLGVFIK